MVLKLVLDLFLFFKKALYKVKASDQHPGFCIPRLGRKIKTNFLIYQTAVPEISSILILELTMAFLSSYFSKKIKKSERKVFNVQKKAFFIIFLLLSTK